MSLIVFIEKLSWYLKRPIRIMSRLHLITPKLEYQIDWVSMGPLNPDKKFLIIRIPGLPEQGQLSAWSSVAADIKWSQQHGYIPVIDYEPITNFDHGQLFIANEWQEVFNQPGNISIRELLRSRHVGIKPIGSLTGDRYTIDSMHDSSFYRAEFEYIKENLWFQPQYLMKLEKTLDEVIPRKARILAVSVREEFELLKKAGWSNSVLHPDEPAIAEVLEEAKRLMVEWNCEYCFIATRYSNTIQLFLEHFRDKLLYTDRTRMRISDEYISYLKGFSSIPSPRERLAYCLKNNKFAQLDKDIRDEYLAEVYILSQCTHLLATKSGASTAAMYWNAGMYEQVYFFEDNHSSRNY